MQEWVQTIGSKAGFTAANTRLSSGAVGAPESRLELEVTVDSMGAWEGLLAAIPPKEHRAWSERVMPRIVDGSPRWDLYRALPIGLAPHSAAEDAAAAAPSSDARPSPARRLPPPVDNSPPPQQTRPSGLTLIDDAAAAEVILDARGSSSSGNGSGSSSGAGDSGGAVMRDWKGDPIRLNPGDKMPGMSNMKFL